MEETMKLKNNPICYKLAVIACCFIVLEANPGSPFPSMAVPSGGEATSVAWSLVNYESFSDPFAPTKTGPTAIVAPVFPFLYAGIMKIFGYNINTMWGIWLGSTLLLAI